MFFSYRVTYIHHKLLPHSGLKQHRKLKCDPLSACLFKWNISEPLMIFFSFFVTYILLWLAPEYLHCLRIYTHDEFSVFALFAFSLLKASMTLQAFRANYLHVFLDASITMPEFACLVQYKINKPKPQSISTLLSLTYF